MPRIKTVIPDEQELNEQTTADVGGENAADQFQEDAPTPEEASEGSSYGEDAGDDFPAEEGTPYPDGGDASPVPPDEGADMESDDPEYGALLQELGEANQREASAEEPLILDPPPGEETSGVASSPVLTGADDGTAGAPPTQPQRSRSRPRSAESAVPTADPRRDRVLTIEARDEVQTAEEREAIVWHEIQNAHWTRRILTGTLGGLERTPSGKTLAVVDYKGFRVAILLQEMLFLPKRMPTNADYLAFMERQRRNLNNMLGAEIDFIVRGIDSNTRSIVASRKDAMLKKRQTFYMNTDELGAHMIYEGRVVQARVVAVAEKVIRVEVFGVECPIIARDLSWEWLGDAREHFCVGDRVLVRVLTIDRSSTEDLSITASIRSVSSTTNVDNVKKCQRQCRYVGRVTDVRSGVVYIRLNNGVNAIAHACYDMRTPGKKDDVSFAVTQLDEEKGIAIGIITRIIKQNL